MPTPETTTTYKSSVATLRIRQIDRSDRIIRPVSLTHQQTVAIFSDQLLDGPTWNGSKVYRFRISQELLDESASFWSPQSSDRVGPTLLAKETGSR